MQRVIVIVQRGQSRRFFGVCMKKSKDLGHAIHSFLSPPPSSLILLLRFSLSLSFSRTYREHHVFAFEIERVLIYRRCPFLSALKCCFQCTINFSPFLLLFLSRSLLIYLFLFLPFIYLYSSAKRSYILGVFNADRRA